MNAIRIECKYLTQEVEVVFFDGNEILLCVGALNSRLCYFPSVANSV